MKKPVFSGVCTALVTPFFEDKVNYPLVEQLLRYQMDAGIKAITLAGTTGESPTLTDEEKTELFRRGKAFTGNRCKIIAGTGSNSTKHSVELSIAAEESGADGLLVVSPYYNKANPDGLIRHYQAIAEAVNIPIILYNVPTRTGVDIPVTVYRELSVLPNINGVKEACTDIHKIAKIRASCPKDFYIWSGNDDQIVPVISLGGHGVISVLSNLCPADTIAITECALDGDFDSAGALQCAVLPLIELLFAEVSPIPVKYAMRYAGFDCGPCRLPLGPLSSDIRKRIDQYFA